MNQPDQLPALTADRARELLAYNPETGELTWRVRRGGKGRLGSIAGHAKADGYRRIIIDGRQYRAHRVAWLIFYGSWPRDCIDHIDGDTNNNRIANLRDVTHAENLQNLRRPLSGNSTGLLGVYPEGDKFRAKIVINRRNKYLGTFSTPEAAHAAYLAAKRELHLFSTL